MPAKTVLDVAIRRPIVVFATTIEEATQAARYMELRYHSYITASPAMTEKIKGLHDRTVILVNEAKLPRTIWNESLRVIKVDYQH